MNNVINQTPFLRTSREFPEEIHQLAQEANKSYVDVANAVNLRSIGLFVVNRPALTGNNYYLTANARNQSFRQAFTFGAIAPGGTITIPYKFQAFTQFVAIYGTCMTALPDSRPIPYSSTGVNSNIDLRVDTVNLTIVISNGSGGPTINSGIIVLEWVANP